MDDDLKLLLLRCAEDVLLTGDWHFPSQIKFPVTTDGYIRKDILGIECKMFVRSINGEEIISMEFKGWMVLINFDLIPFNRMIGSHKAFARSVSQVISRYTNQMIENTNVTVGDNQATFDRDICVLALSYNG